jgi:hypothetical protein
MGSVVVDRNGLQVGVVEDMVRLGIDLVESVEPDVVRRRIENDALPEQRD